MGYGFAYNVIADPSPIYVCDASAVTLTSSGVEISGASAGELIYELGLRNGDKLQEIDGYPLYDWSDVGYAYLVLWILGGDTAYELDILRGTTPMTLNYEIHSDSVTPKAKRPFVVRSFAKYASLPDVLTSAAACVLTACNPAGTAGNDGVTGDTSGSDGGPQSTGFTSTAPTTGADQLCTPGDVDCTDSNGATRCTNDGKWGPPVACPVSCTVGLGCTECTTGASRCVGDAAENCDELGLWVKGDECNLNQGIECNAESGKCEGACLPETLMTHGFSHVGCEFYAMSTPTNMPYGDESLAVFLTNPGDESCTVRAGKVFWTGAVLDLAPHSTEVLFIPWDSELTAPGGKTVLSAASAVHIESTRPIIVTQHSPVFPKTSTEASLLLPVTSWGHQYPLMLYQGLEINDGVFTRVRSSSSQRTTKPVLRSLSQMG